MSSVELLAGDCVERLRDLPDNSIDSVVTDPPYGLGFMGRKWDIGVPAVDVFTECLRVLKPGGHLLAFGGSRTYHRLAVAVEDAGFDIRDQIMWVYAQGFPKSLDVGKAIDKAAGAEREVVSQVKRTGKSAGTYGAMAGNNVVSAPSTEAAKQWDGWGTALKPSFEPVLVASKPFPLEHECVIIQSDINRLGARLWLLLTAFVAEQDLKSSQVEQSGVFDTAQWTADEAINTLEGLSGQMDMSRFESMTNTALSTVSSWKDTLDELLSTGSTSTTGTKLKTTTDWKTLRSCLSEITPESIIKGRSSQSEPSANASLAERYLSAELKRLSCTLELSALDPAISKALQNSQGVDDDVAHEPIVVARKPIEGTVAANVMKWGTGAVNVDGCRVGSEMVEIHERTKNITTPNSMSGQSTGSTGSGKYRQGRFPANLIHSGCPEVLELFPESDTRAAKSALDGTGSGSSATPSNGWGMKSVCTTGYADKGSAARFFYCAKASKKDRGEGNAHPTVKPTSLMRYLCRLVTPPGGMVLDPFMGSGSTGKAAAMEGFSFTGIELEPEYMEIARARIAGATERDCA